MHKITDAVTVRRDEQKAFVVAITVADLTGTEGAEAILAKAWALLAEAINAQKLSDENSRQHPDQGGSGGWWSG